MDEAWRWKPLVCFQWDDDSHTKMLKSSLIAIVICSTGSENSWPRFTFIKVINVTMNHLIPHHCLWSRSSPSSSSWPSPSFPPSSPSTSPSPCHASPKSPRLLFDAIAEQMFHIIPRQTLPCSFLFTSCSFSWNNLAASLMFTSFLSWLGNSFMCAFLKFLVYQST